MDFFGHNNQGFERAGKADLTEGFARPGVIVSGVCKGERQKSERSESLLLRHFVSKFEQSALYFCKLAVRYRY
jgi:hypothetical protein